VSSYATLVDNVFQRRVTVHMIAKASGRTAAPDVTLKAVRTSVLLWDSGDTLADERWMRRAPDGCPTWETAWNAVMVEIADRWDVGRASSSEVFGALASQTGMTPRSGRGARA
jgi:hypothetical protein